MVKTVPNITYVREMRIVDIGNWDTFVIVNKASMVTELVIAKVSCKRYESSF